MQAVYARPSDEPDRYHEIVPSIRRWAVEVDHVISASARLAGGTRHVRFVTNADCELDVMNVTLSPTGDATFDNTVTEFTTQGLRRPDRKYLVWMESDALCGYANFYNDDRPTGDNANNGGRLPATIARVDRGCWGLGARGQSVEAHELVHSLGAVLPSAPHATRAGHCTDDADRMCYDDGSLVTINRVCDDRHEALLDCGHDDYFHVDPPPGTYLATHWNAAASSFLETSAPSIPGADTIARIAGADRIATSVAASRIAYPETGSAAAAVLASAQRFPDALAGVPLAAEKSGPLLLTQPDALSAATAQELRRVLRADAPVYLLGGIGALAARVEDDLRRMGLNTTRYGGANRFETAVIIAEEGLDAPATVLQASGIDFADALAAGAAAAVTDAAVLLTNGTSQSAETAAYLLRHPTARRYAVGGPAAGADPLAERVVGTDRYATAVAVARRFFPQPTTIGVASGVKFPDALSGGAHIAQRVGPVLLSTTTAPLPPPLLDYLRGLATFDRAIVYGGQSSITDDVIASIARATATSR